MKLRCLALFVLLATSTAAAVAQRTRSESRFFRTCDLVGPLTKLEEFDARWETVIVRGSTHVTSTVNGRNGTVDVDAIELRDESNGTRAMGAIVELRDTARPDTNRSAEGRVFIDYEEIDPLIAAWDRVARTDDTITKLNNFESHYRSRGDMEISVFRQTPGGAVAAAVSGGICNRVRILLSLDELIKLRWMIVQAKTKLDELK